MRDKKKIYDIKVSSVYPHYINKVEKKQRSKNDVDELITWLTGYTSEEISDLILTNITFEEFFKNSPNINPDAKKITGLICGYRVEEIEDDIIQKIRYLDKIIDELAKGKSLDKIKRI